MQIFENPIVTPGVLRDALFAVYVVFRQGEVCKRTINIPRKDGEHRVLIDIDHNDYPLAVQVIFSKDIMLQDLVKTSNDTLENALCSIFVFARELLLCHKLNALHSCDTVFSSLFDAMKNVAKDNIKQEIDK